MGGLRTAIEAAQASSTGEAEGALRSALTATLPRKPLLGHSDTVSAAAFSPDEKLVVTTGYDGTARIWDVASGSSLHILAGNGLLNRAEFSPDGKLIVTASADHTARVWDVATGRSLLSLSEADSVGSAAFSPDKQAGRHRQPRHGKDLVLQRLRRARRGLALSGPTVRPDRLSCIDAAAVGFVSTRGRSRRW